MRRAQKRNKTRIPSPKFGFRRPLDGKPLLTRLFALAVFIIVSISLCVPAACSATGEKPETVSPFGNLQNIARDSAGHGKALLLVIDRIGLDNLSEKSSPNIFRLISSGGFALMNARVIRDIYGCGSYLVIGAGGRVIGGPNAGLAFNYNELLTGSRGERIKAGNMYSSRTGREASESSVVNLYIEEIIKNSDNNLATSEPGLLGKTLKDGKKKIALLGNADSLTPSKTTETTLLRDQEYTEGLLYPAEDIEVYPSEVTIHREASCIAMDGEGLVPTGDVSANLSAVNPENTNLTTDFGRLISETESLLPKNDLLVIDLGQTSRVDEGSTYYTDKALEKARNSAIQKCDQAVGEILKLIDPSKDLVIICTPTPSFEMISEGNLLTPLVINGPGFGPGTLIESSTTKRSGIVSNVDIAPTILDFFGLDTPGNMEGRPLTGTPVKTNLDDVKDSRDNILASSVTRKAMVKIYVITAMVLLILFLLCIFFRNDFILNHGFFWKAVMIAILSGPLAYLIYPIFGKSVWYRSTPWIIGICFAAGLAGAAIDKAPRVRELSMERSYVPMIIISGITLVITLIDPLLGSPLMTFSAFGSDIIMGGRYYGIGNLYMGVILGSSMLFSCLVLEVFKKAFDKPWKRYLFTGIIFALVCVFLGSPKIGADFGGLITAVVASGFTLLKLEGKPLSWRRLLIAGVAVLLCIVILVIVVTLLPPEQASHAGKAISRAEETGISSLFSVATRKLSASWTLTFASIWRLLLLLTISGGLLINWRFNLFKQLKLDNPYLMAGMTGMAAGLIAAIFLNDSGIEPAAAISIFLFIPLFLQAIPAAGKSDQLSQVPSDC